MCWAPLTNSIYTFFSEQQPHFYLISSNELQCVRQKIIWHIVSRYGETGYLHLSLIGNCFATVLKSVIDTFLTYFHPIFTMIRSRKQLPKYCRHKPSGRAYVRVGGKMYYLGKYGTEASKREYGRIGVPRSSSTNLAYDRISNAGKLYKLNNVKIQNTLANVKKGWYNY